MRKTEQFYGDLEPKLDVVYGDKLNKIKVALTLINTMDTMVINYNSYNILSKLSSHVASIALQT